VSDVWLNVEKHPEATRKRYTGRQIRPRWLLAIIARCDLSQKRSYAIVWASVCCTRPYICAFPTERKRTALCGSGGGRPARQDLLCRVPLQRRTETFLRACVHLTLHSHGLKTIHRHTTGFTPTLLWRHMRGYRIAGVGQNDPTLSAHDLFGRDIRLRSARRAAMAMGGTSQSQPFCVSIPCRKRRLAQHADGRVRWCRQAAPGPLPFGGGAILRRRRVAIKKPPSGPPRVRSHLLLPGGDCSLTPTDGQARWLTSSMTASCLVPCAKICGGPHSVTWRCRFHAG